MAFLKDFFVKTRHITLYGLLLASLILVLKWLQWTFLIVDNALDIYVGLIAVIFTLMGIGLTNWLVKPKVQTVVVEREVYVSQPSEFAVNEVELGRLNLSKREYEVLQLIARGYSNAAIAESLFLSLSTVKTHVSNLFDKMEVKSRVQVVEKAKRLKIIA